MVEDPVEENKCIICGKETKRLWRTLIKGEYVKDIPLCEECEHDTSRKDLIKASEEYYKKRDGIDIAKTLAQIMKEKKWEHYKGQYYQGEEKRFFIKDGILVTVIVNYTPDEEILESIMGTETE